MNRLVSGTFSAKSKLSGTNSGVEKMGKSFLNRRSENFVHSVGQGDGTVVREITGVMLNFLTSMTISEKDQESGTVEVSRQ